MAIDTTKIACASGTQYILRLSHAQIIQHRLSVHMLEARFVITPHHFEIDIQVKVYTADGFNKPFHCVHIHSIVVLDGYVTQHPRGRFAYLLKPLGLRPAATAVYRRIELVYAVHTWDLRIGVAGQ